MPRKQPLYATVLSVAKVPRLHLGSGTAPDRSPRVEPLYWPMRHTVNTSIQKDGKAVCRNQNGEVWTEPADHVVANDCAKSVAALGRKGSEGQQQKNQASGVVVYLVTKALFHLGVRPTSSFSMTLTWPRGEQPCLSQSAIRR